MLKRTARPGDVHRGRWNGLGGKFESSETPEACVIREVEEESGLVISNPQLVGFLTFPAFAKEEDWYVYVFVARQFSGELRNSEEGNLEWIADSELLQLDLWEGDPIFLKWIEAGKFFSAKFVYQNEKLIEHSVVFYPTSS